MPVGKLPKSNYRCNFLERGCLIVGGSFRSLSNRFLRVTASHSIEQRVEWAYAFDVHCNAFFPVFLILYVVQFFFIPILVRSSWISLLIGNTMYFLSFAWYAYGTFLGYNGKYLDKTQCATVVSGGGFFGIGNVPLLSLGHLSSL